MAQLVLGMGMSHSTMVTLDDSLCGEWAAQDATFAILFDKEGQAVTYSQIAERAGDRYAQQATPQHWKKQYAAVRQAVARLADEVASARLTAPSQEPGVDWALNAGHDSDLSMTQLSLWHPAGRAEVHDDSTLFRGD